MEEMNLYAINTLEMNESTSYTYIFTNIYRFTGPLKDKITTHCTFWRFLQNIM